MPFGADITNKASGQAALPIAPKKSAAPLACIANGNLRSRRVLLDQMEDKVDECMQDVSAIMSVTPASEMSNADISMLSANARGDTTVTMREPTSSRSSGSDDSEKSDEDPHDGVLQVLKKSTARVSNLLSADSKTNYCPTTKAVIKLANQLATGNGRDVLDLKRLPYRDTSTRSISRVLGRGGFKLVLEDQGRALAVFRKQEEDGNTFPKLHTDLLILQEILTSVLLSAHRSSIPNFLHVDGIFRAQTCRRFFPEDVVAFRMEKGLKTLDEVYSFFATPLNPSSKYPEIDQYFFQLVCALAYMHSVLDIYHCDLKPSNILVTNSTSGDSKTANATFQYQLDGKCYSMSLPRPMAMVKICDLGSAMPNVKIYNDTISGTPVYRPPEYFLEGSFAPAGSCSDVFAAGLMMLQTYLGERHDEFIMRELEAEDCIDDYLFDLVPDERLCQMIYGYFVLFSTREDIFIYRQASKIEEGWPADTGSITVKFLSMIAESSLFFADWELFSIQSGISTAMIELRRKIGCGGDPANASDPRLNAFLSMVRIDPTDRATAAELAISSLFEHLEVAKSNARVGDVVCRLGKKIFD